MLFRDEKFDACSLCIHSVFIALLFSSFVLAESLDDVGVRPSTTARTPAAVPPPVQPPAPAWASAWGSAPTSATAPATAPAPTPKTPVRLERKVVAKAQQKTGKRLASLGESDAYSTVRVDAPATSGMTPFFMRLGLGVGVAAATPGQAATSAVKSEGSFLLSGTGDFRYGYIGFEVEGYSGTAGRTLAPSNSGTLGTLYNTQGIGQTGSMFNVKGQLPFQTGRVKWVPKVGVGYGFDNLALGESYNSTASGNNTVLSANINEQAKGFFLVAGLEIEPFSFLILSADDAVSVSSSGSYGIQGTFLDSMSHLISVPRISLSADSA